MCNACNQGPKGQKTLTHRRRLWEMTGNWHCSIIGTCLTLADLRALAKKLRLETNPDFPLDYQVHGYFARIASEPGKAAKMLNKRLDRQHAAAIAKARSMKTVQELERHWQEAMKAGDIPGPYWALLSHPSAPVSLCERAFADVHMLSHLVGASNRADIRRLASLEDDNTDLRARYARVIKRQQDRLQGRDYTISALREKMISLEAMQSGAGPIAAPCVAADSNDGLADECARLRHELGDAVAVTERLECDLAALHEAHAALRAENSILENQLNAGLCGRGGGCPFDLGGRCVLYVGGRMPTVTRLRSLVETWNGQLEHHDGGVEKSMDELAGAIVRADAVVFPTDCVSHEAALRVKKLCRQSMKPFVPLRSSGVGSFIAGVQSNYNDLTNSAADWHG